MREDPKSVVGRNIRRLREKRGWSQEKLAEVADLDRTYVGRIERGEKNIGVDNLTILARALGVAPAALLDNVR
uniref:XRE family transcriptional regulator n=1 Tax=candidate division WOR-3 bacterium TaxID=2052148 RepID=A0A7C4CD97_UNCW3